MIFNSSVIIAVASWKFKSIQIHFEFINWIILTFWLYAYNFFSRFVSNVSSNQFDNRYISLADKTRAMRTRESYRSLFVKERQVWTASFTSSENDYASWRSCRMVDSKLRSDQPYLILIRTRVILATEVRLGQGAVSDRLACAYSWL